MTVFFSYTDNLMALKPNPLCQLSLWEETDVPGENPRLSAERWLYSLHMRTGFESTLGWTLLGIEPGILEVKGEWSDHYTTARQCLLTSVNVSAGVMLISIFVFVLSH